MLLNKQPILSSLFILLLSGNAAAWTVTPVDEAHPKWTGLYLSAGAGMGAWTADSKVNVGGHTITATQTQGGKGPYITAAAGYDYLICKYAIVAGAFIDGGINDFSGTNAFPGVVGDMSETDSIAIGARLGKLINASVLPYITAGFSRAYFDKVNYNLAVAGGGATGLANPAFTANGWLLGAGLEVKLSQNWSLKGEYRYANYNRQSLSLNNNGLVGGIVIPIAATMPFNPTTQTFQAVIAYKF